MPATPATPEKRPGKPPKGWRVRFLAALADTGNARDSARAAGVDRATAYRHREKDEGFADAWEAALQDATDSLEMEARRRAVEGVEEPVFHKGERVGSVRRYSDTLLIFLLKAHRPEKYRDNFDLGKVVAGLIARRAPRP